MRTALLTAVVALTLTGCATSKQIDDTNKNIVAVGQSVTNLSMQMAIAQSKANAAAKLGPEPGCYLAGERYSPGAVVAGRVCGNQKEVVDDRLSEQWGWAPNLR